MLNNYFQNKTNQTEEPILAKLINIFPFVLSAACAAAAVAGLLG